ncbi:MAG TPA: vitamin K epoxide reductase family protein [Verrucomicrobiae bacterium]|nr:vitamin K epoxide reductase family protein [Verrucomicrobiae bacterium]
MSDRGRGAEPAAGAAGVGGALWLAGLALIGFGLAAYLTSVHYAAVPLACPSTGVINCQLVTTSSYSVIPGTSVPITVPGMLYFLLSLGLAIQQLREPERAGWRQLHAAWAGLGTLTVFYLVFVEMVKLHEICLWCTGVHLVILATLITTVWRVAADRTGPAGDTLSSAAS